MLVLILLLAGKTCQQERVNNVLVTNPHLLSLALYRHTCSGPLLPTWCL